MNTTHNKTVAAMAAAAKAAIPALARLTDTAKNAALAAMADAIDAHTPAIIEANQRDVEWARGQNIAAALLSRLALDANKVRGMAQGIRSVMRLPDPVGQCSLVMEMDQNLVLRRETCPIGVIGAIFESRPDALPQIASLCLKSGNAVLLKGGSEAQHSNRILYTVLAGAAQSVPGIPEAALQLIETRAEVAEMLREEKNISLIVPRGGNAFVQHILNNTKIPVLGHADGICHVYIDRDADARKAADIVLDAKTQYPAACNAMETLLVHKDVAAAVLPGLAEKLAAKKVDLLGCETARAIVPSMRPAAAADWDTEYCDLKLAVKVVADLDAAINHINTHGSGHTDAIISENQTAITRFLSEVDSASVMANASTRFADGFRYGLGAEIGISTNKTHARGPVGLEGLVIYKYKLTGNGQTVGEYSGPNAKSFTHKRIFPV